MPLYPGLVAALRSVMFDLDGTLVDVAGAAARCVGRIAAASKATEIDPEATRAAFRSTRSARARLASWVAGTIVSHGGTPPSTRTIARALRDVARDVEPDLRVVEVVASVARSHRVAVVTNGPRDLQRAKLRAAGLAELLPPSSVFVSGELGVRKPDARIFRRALVATGAPAEATLFVGDDELEDIEGARALGMRTCRVAPAGTPTSADERVEHVSALPRVLACVT